jgi:2-(1,2-epoxy-1,2-dihydrophenyl)acetyl-CoA isomerase
MGLDRALKMSLLSEVYDATTAHGLGLVTEVVADSLLEERCLSFCETLVEKAPLAMRLTKMMMTRAVDLSLEDSMIDAQMAVMITNPSADAREGVRAFLEKRPPRFEGH